MLSRKNIDFNAEDTLGLTQLLKACIDGHKEVVEQLLSYPNSGIEFNATDNNGRTGFMLPSMYGYKDVVQLIKLKLNL